MTREPEQTQDLVGKVCVVIGGGAAAVGWSIGKALSIAYARSGAKVVVCDRDGNAAQAVVDQITDEGGEAVAIEVEAADSNSVARAVDTTRECFERIDVLHNNVGIGKAGESSNTSPDDWRRIADANLLSLHVASQAAIPVMKANGGGVILSTSTVGSLLYLGYPHLAYNVTKAAANHFSRMIAAEYASYRIRANTLIVGLMDTPRIRNTLQKTYGGSEESMLRQRDRQVPLGFMGDAWDVAHAAVFLASDKARYISGAEIVIDGALTATTRPATSIE
jgi:NAD(P)-dependent dehydrogenase (short-subunit alcohol dehydrogenase family)